jgi:hypothetical protein
VIRRVCSILAAMLLVPVAMAAPPAADRDTLEVNAYVLTEAAFTKYAQATKKLQAAPGRDADCDDDDDGGSTDASIAAQVARLEAIPGARAVLQSAGLATREYVVIGWSLLQAGIAAWSLAQPGGKLPAGVSMANVTFYRAHEPVITALGAASRSRDCGDDEGG